LVRAAHATGDRVVMIGFIDDATIHRPLIHYLASVVAAIGLEPTIDWTRHAAFTDAQHAALIPQGWYADYPAASDFFGLFLSCHAAYNGGKFCDRRLDRDVRAASAAEAVDARRAATLWAAADRFAVDDAAWVPLANPTLFDFTSRRIRGYRHHLLWGFLPDQVDVR
jgi:ABC-type transport system substrate-binding protein